MPPGRSTFDVYPDRRIGGKPFASKRIADSRSDDQPANRSSEASAGWTERPKDSTQIRTDRRNQRRRTKDPINIK
jgi:hypothetical protein